MDKAILVDRDISDGKKLIKSLDKSEFKISSALWLYTSELDEWKLILASSYVDIHGQKEAYKIIQQKLHKIKPPFGISLSSIKVVGANYWLIQLLRMIITTSPTDISEMRFTRIVINGTMIEDALLYRVT